MRVALMLLVPLACLGQSPAGAAEPLRHAQLAGSDRATIDAQRTRFVERLESLPAPPLEKEMTLREAMEQIGAAAKVPITGLWSPRFTPGIDPERRLTLQMRPKASCMEALEALLYEIDDGGDPVLWQTTRFGIEVGARSSLWRPKAIETRVYDVKDLLIRVPAFRSTGVPQPGGMGGGQGGGGSPGGAGGNAGSGGGSGGGGGGAGGNVEDPTVDQKRQLRTEELIQLIQASVEPEAWSPAGGPCSIASRDGLLVIRAPDFVHRRIDDPVRPPPRKPRKPDAGDGR